MLSHSLDCHKATKTMRTVNAYAALQVNGELEPFTYQLPDIGSEEVDIKVHYCGICHSDLSMIKNDWGSAQFPLVPGHEVVGEVVETGEHVKGLKVGDMVGLGWNSASCMHCAECMSGDQHLCRDREGTIVGRHGGFGDYVRAHWSWAIPLPPDIDARKSGPLFCGGITVFNPIVIAEVKPTDKVGVIGIGGLGHMALKFLKHWGCEVFAFSSNPDKESEILAMGASRVINSQDPNHLKSLKGQLHFILNTTNKSLEWSAYISCLASNGKFHTVGAVLEPMPISAFSLIGGQKSISGSPLGSPALTKTMLNFCVRHHIYPTTEEFPMNRVNEALQHLRSGKARYRIVLKNN